MSSDPFAKLLSPAGQATWNRVKQAISRPPTPPQTPVSPATPPAAPTENVPAGQKKGADNYQAVAGAAQHTFDPVSALRWGKQSAAPADPELATLGLKAGKAVARAREALAQAMTQPPLNQLNSEQQSLVQDHLENTLTELEAFAKNVGSEAGLRRSQDPELQAALPQDGEEGIDYARLEDRFEALGAAMDQALNQAVQQPQQTVAVADAQEQQNGASEALAALEQQVPALADQYRRGVADQTQNLPVGEALAVTQQMENNQPYLADTLQSALEPVRSSQQALQQALDSGSATPQQLRALQTRLQADLDQAHQVFDRARQNPAAVASRAREAAEGSAQARANQARHRAAELNPPARPSDHLAQMDRLIDRARAAGQPQDVKRLEGIKQRLLEQQQFQKDMAVIAKGSAALRALEGFNEAALSPEVGLAVNTLADAQEALEMDGIKALGPLQKALSVLDSANELKALLAGKSDNDRLAGGVALLANAMGSPFAGAYASAIRRADAFAQAYQPIKDQNDVMDLFLRYKDPGEGLRDVSDLMAAVNPF